MINCYQEPLLTWLDSSGAWEALHMIEIQYFNRAASVWRYTAKKLRIYI